jgi:hypothetical protein
MHQSSPTIVQLPAYTRRDDLHRSVRHDVIERAVEQARGPHEVGENLIVGHPALGRVSKSVVLVGKWRRVAGR